MSRSTDLRHRAGAPAETRSLRAVWLCLWLALVLLGAQGLGLVHRIHHPSQTTLSGRSASASLGQTSAATAAGWRVHEGVGARAWPQHDDQQCRLLDALTVADAPVGAAVVWVGLPMAHLPSDLSGCTAAPLWTTWGPQARAPPVVWIG